MKTHIRIFHIEDYVWRGVYIRGQLYLLNRVCPVGQCYRP